MSKSLNSLDVYFHMANHYKKLNNTKSRVNSGCKKKTNNILVDELDMKQNKKPNLNMESTGKVTQRNGRPKTRRNLSDMPHQMVTKSRGHSNKSNVSKDRSSTIAKKSGGKSARSKSQSSRNSSNSSNHAAGDTRNTSADRSTTHGVESIAKDGVNEHEYLQFALRITEDIIKNDLYSCVEMKRVFNSHIEANRGRLDVNRMKEQIRTLAKELNVKFDESEIYTLGPLDFCKNYQMCDQTNDTRCELIYVAKDMKDFDECRSAHSSNYNENHCNKQVCESLSKKDSQAIVVETNCDTCCKSMNTLPENKDNCDACTNTKIVVLKNTLISGDSIDPQEAPHPSEDHAVQVKSEFLKVVENKSQACCKSLEKLWVVDVGTSMSHENAIEKPRENEPKILKFDSDSSINSAEMFKASLEHTEPHRYEIQSLITKNILPAVQIKCHCTESKSKITPKDDKVIVSDDHIAFTEPVQDNEQNQFKTQSSELRHIYYDKPLETKQEYLFATSSHFSTERTITFEESDNQLEQSLFSTKRHCTCGCCKKSEQPSTDKVTIWDESDVNDVYCCPDAEEKKPARKPANLFEGNHDLFEIIEPEKEKKAKCPCGKLNCGCKLDEYANYLPEMLAKFFPSIATQTTPSDLLLINVKSRSDEHKQHKEFIEAKYEDDSFDFDDEQQQQRQERQQQQLQQEQKPDESEDIDESNEIVEVSNENDEVSNENELLHEAPTDKNLLLTEISPLESILNMESSKPSKALSFDQEPIHATNEKKKVRTSFSKERADSALDNNASSASEMLKSASGTLHVPQETQESQEAVKVKLRERSAEYEKRKSSFLPNALIISNENFDNDEDKSVEGDRDDKDEKIPIIIPDREEQQACKKEQSNREKMLENSSSSRFEIEMNNEAKSVTDNDLADIEDFMSRLDYKPTVTKTSSFDKRVKKTINDGEMFRHPENRRIGFESHSGIDLNRTTIAEEEHQKTVECENEYEKENEEESDAVDTSENEEEQETKKD